MATDARSMFQRATKKQSKLRMALIGPAGSGKTYTALRLATGLGERIAVVDTERGSASKYSDDFTFDVCELTSFAPARYIEAIRDAESAGYDVLIIDSLSHAWAGKDGVLEFVDKVARRSQSGNSFAAWREATPIHNELVDTMLDARLHLIVTLRAKMEYVQERDEKTGKTTIRKVGLQPVQRDGLEYEFDVVGDMTVENDLIVTKTRCKPLTGGVYSKPGPDDVGKILIDWLSDGAPAPESKRPRFEPILCEECREPITAMQVNGATITAERVSEQRRKRYGKALCTECAGKAQQARTVTT